MSVTSQPASPPSPPSRAVAPRQRSWLRAELPFVLGAAVVTSLLAAICLRLWHLKLHVPLFQSGDQQYTMLVTKTVMREGWLGINQHIGAPFGGALYDHIVAFGDTTQLGLAKVLGIVSSDPAAVVNAVFLLGFPIIAMVAYLVLRGLGFGTVVSLTCAVVYALMPFHFLRNESHLALGAYWSVPVAAWLAFGVFGHVRLLARREAGGGRLTGWLSRRTLVTVLACVVVGTSGVYYAVFLLAIVTITALALALVERDVRRLAVPAAICVVVVASVLVAQAPQLAYHASHGANHLVGQRLPIESELYGLKAVGLVVPAADHHVRFLADLGAKYWLGTSLPGEGPNTWLGTSMTIGLLAVLAAAIAAMLGRVALTPRARLLRDAGALASTCIAIGSIGGLSTLFAYLVSPQIRGWDRISVFIGFFALVGLATVLTAIGARLRTLPHGPVVAAVLALGLMGFAAYDQMLPTGAPNYEASLLTWRNDARFVAAVDRQMPAGAAILQLPYVPFPENPPVMLMTDYDQLKGPIHSEDLRFSYGATKGRLPDDWLAVRSGEPIARLLPGAVAAGFAGVWVDTFGYAASGQAVTHEIEQLTRAGPSAISDDRRHLFYDLRPLSRRIDRGAGGERAAAGVAELHPVTLTWAGGFYPVAEGDGTSSWHWARSSGVLELGNTRPEARQVDVKLRLATPARTAQTVTVTFDGSARTIRVPGGQTAPLRATVTLAPGRNTMRFATDAPDETSDPRDLRLRAIDATITDVSIDNVVAAARR